MFLIKKIFAPFFYPLPLCLILSVIGIILLWCTRRQKLGRFFATMGTGMLILFSSSFFSNTLLNPLESKYQVTLNAKLPEVSWIVILSGGHTSDPSLPLASQLSGPALARLIEGIRMQKSLPKSKLILTGGGYGIPESEIMAELASALGVIPKSLVLESKSRDTKDQARYVKEIVKKDKFILITSAYHMPRSMALFRNIGLSPIPAPTNHLVKRGHVTRPRIPLPSSLDLHKATLAIHEYMGLVWAKLRGQI